MIKEGIEGNSTISFFLLLLPLLLMDDVSDLKDQLNLLAEAFHKYEIAEVRLKPARHPRHMDGPVGITS